METTRRNTTISLSLVPLPERKGRVFQSLRTGAALIHDEFNRQSTLDLTAVLTVPAAIRFGEGLLHGGWPPLRQHNHDLALAARSLLCDRLGVEPPCLGAMLGSMATLPLPRALQEKDPGESRAVIARFDPLQSALLEQHRIEVPIVRWGTPARLWFRISAHAYHSLGEFTHLTGALEAAPKSGRP